MRRLFMWHPRLKEVAARTRVSRGKYKCEGCGWTFGPKEMRYDHMEPAVAITGFVDFGMYARRLLDAVPEGIQHLCMACHDAKTAREREARVAARHAKVS